MGNGKDREKRTMFSSSVCRLRRVFTVSRIESFIFFLVVSKVLVRLLSSLGTGCQDGYKLKQVSFALFQLQHGLVFLLQNLHPFVVLGSFFLLVAIFHHSEFVLDERQDDVQKVFLGSYYFGAKSTGTRGMLALFSSA